MSGCSTILTQLQVAAIGLSLLWSMNYDFLAETMPDNYHDENIQFVTVKLLTRAGEFT